MHKAHSLKLEGLPEAVMERCSDGGSRSCQTLSMQGSCFSERHHSAQDIDAAVKTYHYLSERWFTHASPTLFNAGTPRPQLSSCFLICMKVCLGPVGLVQSCDHKLDVMHAVQFFSGKLIEYSCVFLLLQIRPVHASVVECSWCLP